jgi:hypothetical protein
MPRDDARTTPDDTLMEDEDIRDSAELEEEELENVDEEDDDWDIEE